MTNLVEMLCSVKDPVDAHRFHMHHFTDVGCDSAAPVLLGGWIDPDHVRKMFMEFLEIGQGRNGRFFTKFDGPVRREQFMRSHVSISHEKNPVFWSVFFEAPQ